MHGIDISHHNYDRMKHYLPAEVKVEDFFILKATEGRTYKDPKLDEYYDLLHGSTDGRPDPELLYGFYHYARPENNTPKEEAYNFLNAVGHHAGQSIFALDWEGNALKYTYYIDWAREWLDIIYSETQVKPVFYIQRSYLQSNPLAISKILKGDNALWVASYKETPPDTSPWPCYTLWQYTSTPIDCDLFNGNETQWRAIARGDR